MFKPEEKVIFSIKSGFSLTGVKEYDLTDKCLQLTNLGNIYISKVDCLHKENSDFMIYDYMQHGKNLQAEVDVESINIISPQLPFTKIKNGIETTVFLNLIMVLDMEEFLEIEEELESKLFEFKEVLMAMDKTYLLSGRLKRKEKVLLFNTADNEFIFKLDEIEELEIKESKIVLRGYFYNEKMAMISREVSFIGKSEIDWREIHLETEFNSKIGRIPKSDPVVYSKIKGRIEETTFVDEECFLIRQQGIFKIFTKNEKKEIVHKSIRDFSKYRLSEEHYILYDGIHIYNIYVNDYDAFLLGVDKLPRIMESNIGFTRKERPFFIDTDKNNINIYSSKDNPILKIERDKISDISISSETDKFYEGFIFVEIRYSDKVVYLYLKQNIITEIAEQVFSEYQLALFGETGVEEIYENWIKTISDRVIYNYFSSLYKLCIRFLQDDLEEMDKVAKFTFANEIYEEFQKEKQNIDFISTYLRTVLEKNEVSYFENKGLAYDISPLKEVEDIFLEIRRDINSDIEGVIKSIDMISFVILPEHARDTYSMILKDDKSYQVDYFTREARKKIEHISYTLLPHYIGRIIKVVFENYSKMYYNYEKIEVEELKAELISRIKSTHMFKQLMFAEDYSVLRKDVIDDLYSLVKFCSMKAESEFYLKGGF